MDVLGCLKLLCEKYPLSPDPRLSLSMEGEVGDKVIPFMGDELAAALTENGGIFISLLGMRNALGLNV